MSVQSSTIVRDYCNVLRDDGISYGDYVEQFTYLIFLKMDDENALLGKPCPYRIPKPGKPFWGCPNYPRCREMVFEPVGMAA